MNHGLYVWSAYGVMLVAMGGEVLVLVLRRRSLRRRKTSAKATHS